MKGERLLSLWYVFIYVYFLGLNKQALLTLLTSGPVSTVASVLVLNLPRGFSVWRCHVLFSCLCGHCSFLPQSTFYDEKPVINNNHAMLKITFLPYYESQFELKF